MSSRVPYEKQPMAKADLPDIGEKWHFVGIDLAPNEALETGVVVLDRNKQVMRMDKLNSDAEILYMLEHLGGGASIIVALDIPKSLSIQGRWRQEEVKMFPLRLEKADGEFTDRCSVRTWNLYEALTKKGILVLLYFSHSAKFNYNMSIPFRARTPQGCRALQAMIKQKLQLKNMSSNLAPSSVLDAMVSAYVAWSVYRGEDSKHFKLSCDQDKRVHMEPLALVAPAPRKRRIRPWDRDRDKRDS